mmetsp:Transcript_5785/g.15016  ORF Transcript_5785/g.15016 Transcript_5785/m.15016 type:complete len:261 (-) Transcript_5785:257-1039(-)
MAKLWASIEGFTVGAVTGAKEAPGEDEQISNNLINNIMLGKVHGMTSQQVVKDLDGNVLATIEYASSNLEMGHLSGRILEGTTTIATFDKPKRIRSESEKKKFIITDRSPKIAHAVAPIMFNVNGVSYANVAFENTMGVRYDGRWLPAVLTRLDGSGGLRMAERSFERGIFSCFGLFAPTPTVVGLTSLDRAQRFPPQVREGSKTTCAFSTKAIPAILDKTVKKYINKHNPGALEGAAKLDALLILVATQTRIALPQSWE